MLLGISPSPSCTLLPKESSPKGLLAFLALLGLVWSNSTLTHYLPFFPFFVLVLSSNFLPPLDCSIILNIPLNLQASPTLPMLLKTMEQSPEGKTYFHSILKSNFHTRSIFQNQCLPSEGLGKPCSEAISSHKSYLGHLGSRNGGNDTTLGLELLPGTRLLPRGRVPPTCL